jgi:hypothetical protein
MRTERPRESRQRVQGVKEDEEDVAATLAALEEPSDVATAEARR